MRTLTSFARLRALAAAALLLGAAAACDKSTTSVDANDLGFPAAGQFTGTLAATDTLVSTGFVAGRSGSTSVAVCGPEGTNFEVALEGTASTSTGNCKQFTFDAHAGFTYHVTLKPNGGSGPFNGCFSATSTCTPPTPDANAGACTAPYYAAATGKTGAALIQSLHDIIANQRVLGYTQARESLYTNVSDPDNDNVITDIYVGRTVSGISSISTATASNINTEHSWPQSKGANEDPANSDLNILFPADATGNTERSNHPFGTVVSATWTSPTQPGLTEHSRLGTNANGVQVFEPRDSEKGDIARAILYFYVRYKSTPTPSFSLSNFNIEESTLLAWAAQDPPSAFEKQRNDLVFRAQGNRNPFVDCPSFVGAIGDFPNAGPAVP